MSRLGCLNINQAEKNAFLARKAANRRQIFWAAVHVGTNRVDRFVPPLGEVFCREKNGLF
ncbi:MAG: hypothetical protein IAE66_02020 [Xanthomonadaceae bacterium]|nr:hypothetical protein [Xanthomonadaceae bacterium]